MGGHRKESRREWPQKRTKGTKENQSRANHRDRHKAERRVQFICVSLSWFSFVPFVRFCGHSSYLFSFQSLLAYFSARMTGMRASSSAVHSPGVTVQQVSVANAAASNFANSSSVKPGAPGWSLMPAS